MFTKTIIPESASVVIDLPASYVGEHVRLIAVIEKEKNEFSPNDRKSQVANTYSKYPKVDLSNFKFNRDEANDFE